MSIHLGCFSDPPEPPLVPWRPPLVPVPWGPPLVPVPWGPPLVPWGPAPGTLGTPSTLVVVPKSTRGGSGGH